MFKPSHLLVLFLISLLLAVTTQAIGSSDQDLDSTDSYHQDPTQKCFDCHEDDQPHEGLFGEDCSRCHRPGSWDPPVFDHDMLRFPLIGSHNEVDCGSCHSEPPASAGLRSCQDCHSEDEPHDQLFGQNCANCHNPNGWDRRQFDHNEHTIFPLIGTHQRLDCSDCHKVSIKTALPSQDCVDCHRQIDPHRGDFGDKCGRCHLPTDFKDLKMNY